MLAAPQRSHAALVEVAGISHAAMGRDDCTRAIAMAFLRDPAGPQDVGRLASRAAMRFELRDAGKFIRSMKSG